MIINLKINDDHVHVRRDVVDSEQFKTAALNLSLKNNIDP